MSLFGCSFTAPVEQPLVPGMTWRIENSKSNQPYYSFLRNTGPNLYRPLVSAGKLEAITNRGMEISPFPGCYPVPARCTWTQTFCVRDFTYSHSSSRAYQKSYRTFNRCFSSVCLYGSQFLPCHIDTQPRRLRTHIQPFNCRPNF